MVLGAGCARPSANSCPSGLVWNRNGQYCDWPASAGAVAGRYQPAKFR
ncbi:carbohydrate-binding module family 14 protein [Nocardia sp. NPDC051990]